MTTRVNTIIVGGGQAGLAVSYFLSLQGRDHLILEQAAAPAEAWRNHRWDSFTLNTPNWQSALPGAPHAGDPDAFMSRAEIIAYLERYAERLPVRYNTRVVSIERDARWGSYVVATAEAQSFVARNVVIATGLYQRPNIPAFAANFPAQVLQIHSDDYRNPQALPSGAVLVVGSAQSGAQIAEELYESGRKVYLAVGRAGRTPRRYRGKDANWWSEKLGIYERSVDQLPSPRAKFAGKPHISGTRGGHTLDLHQFARDGVILLGHLEGVAGGRIKLAPDLHDNLARADQHAADFAQAVDAYVAATGMTAPEDTLTVLRDGFAAAQLGELDLSAAGTTSVIWATSYRFDFSIVRLPVFDADGFPMQSRGATAYPGLYFVGLPWLHNGKSGLLYGVGGDAAHIARTIAGDVRSSAPVFERRGVGKSRFA
jgi:putative flavoprotein involved in K+ transport